MKEQAIICDIDGVLVEYVEYPSNDDFYKNIKEYVIIPVMVDLVDLLSYQYKILFVTARQEEYREFTYNQLAPIFCYDDSKFDLYMRKQKDLRSTDDIKQDLLKELLQKYDIKLAIDDDPFNIMMYKRNGIPTMEFNQNQ